MKNKFINWNNAKKIIPGGNSFYSKRAEQYLYNYWPSYYSKSKGCFVYDLNKKKYIDMLMGIGTNILGYSNEAVNRSVKKAIDSGNMSTLNCPEEYILAKELLRINKWAQNVKFARGGGEANAIAVRIARAFSGKDNIAVCGYHGWHDWYLSANLNKKDNLKKHLLSGLVSKGIPKNLKNTVFPFKYNDFDELKKIVNQKNIGIIKMEVIRNIEPKNNFLKKICKLAKKKKIVLIFDECTSGFRQTFGGIHKYFKITPDIAIYGKSLGNGYPITAIVGKKKIMQFANESFISSTFWSEKVGFIAALETLKQMKKYKSWKKITKTGNKIKKNWKLLSDKYNLKIDILGIPAICSFKFKSKYSMHYITFITQEMLKNGYLANNTVYVSLMHNKKILKKYYHIIDICFKIIKDCETGKLNIKKLIKSPPKIQGFFRLN